MRKRKKTKNRIPSEVAEMVRERADGHCESMRFPICTGQPEQLHHRRMRSQGGEHTVVNIIAVCASCHQSFHRGPAESYERGWLVRSVHEPEAQAVFYRGRPAILGTDGSVEYQPIEG